MHWIAPVLDGKLTVISTVKATDELNNNQAPEEAKLFVYDVRAQKIVREIVPLAKARTTGLITEAPPGRLLGLTTTGDRGGVWKTWPSLRRGCDDRRGALPQASPLACLDRRLLWRNESRAKGASVSSRMKRRSRLDNRGGENER